MGDSGTTPVPLSLDNKGTMWKPLVLRFCASSEIVAKFLIWACMLLVRGGRRSSSRATRHFLLWTTAERAVSPDLSVAMATSVWVRSLVSSW